MKKIYFPRLILPIASCLLGVIDLAVILGKMIEKNLMGIYNLGCKNRMSKYDYACLSAKRAGFSQQYIDHFIFDKDLWVS